MSLLWRLVFNSRCTSTHHKLALDALRFLRGPDAELWSNLFLANHEQYLSGSKAPDNVFKDFKNHVLHVGDNFWGGAPQTARNWYQKTVHALTQGNWPDAIYNAGVLSHYFTDPFQPFHTGQSEAEGNVHRAAEWSIAKSYDELQGILEQDLGGYPQWELDDSRQDWLEEAIRQGARAAHPSYQVCIDHYDLARGVKHPPDGLDQEIKDRIAHLVGLAAVGFARVLDRAFAEAACTPPDVAVSLHAFIATLKIPLNWITRKLTDLRDRSVVEAIYLEVQERGKAIETLPEDEQAVRKQHALEVLKMPLRELDAQPVAAVGTKYGQGKPARGTTHRPAHAPAFSRTQISGQLRTDSGRGAVPTLETCLTVPLSSIPLPDPTADAAVKMVLGFPKQSTPLVRGSLPGYPHPDLDSSAYHSTGSKSSSSGRLVSPPGLLAKGVDSTGPVAEESEMALRSSAIRPRRRRRDTPGWQSSFPELGVPQLPADHLGGQSSSSFSDLLENEPVDLYAPLPPVKFKAPAPAPASHLVSPARMTHGSSEAPLLRQGPASLPQRPGSGSEDNSLARYPAGTDFKRSNPEESRKSGQESSLPGSRSAVASTTSNSPSANARKPGASAGSPGQNSGATIPTPPKAAGLEPTNLPRQRESVEKKPVLNADTNAGGRPSVAGPEWQFPAIPDEPNFAGRHSAGPDKPGPDRSGLDSRTAPGTSANSVPLSSMSAKSSFPAATESGFSFQSAFTEIVQQPPAPGSPAPTPLAREPLVKEPSMAVPPPVSKAPAPTPLAIQGLMQSPLVKGPINPLTASASAPSRNTLAGPASSSPGVEKTRGVGTPVPAVSSTAPKPVSERNLRMDQPTGHVVPSPNFRPPVPESEDRSAVADDPVRRSPASPVDRLAGHHRQPLKPTPAPSVPPAVQPQAGTKASRETRSPRVANDRSSSEKPASGRRFYLDPSASVVDAPSIGPKTAERLKKISVTTVSDLLRINPDQAAADLGSPALANTLKEWQAQALLVCRVPDLRGHDAQFLVACGIRTPEQLVACEPAEVLEAVQAFLATSTGQRLLRGGTPPDLAEVTDWIECAANSRSLRSET